MASTAISYGTEIWLAELKRDGWNLTVSERIEPSEPNRVWVKGAWGVTVALDAFEPMTLLAPPIQVGVLATDERGAGVFVPCPDKDCAWRLLERVDDEVAGVV